MSTSRAVWEREPNAQLHTHVDARSARPGLAWGPFSVGTVFALGCYAIFGVGVYATVTWSPRCAP